MSSNLYTFPHDGVTQPGDEFHAVINGQGRWHTVPMESVGQPIDGDVMIRRPYRPDPSAIAAELEAAVQAIEQTVAAMGNNLGVLKEALNVVE